MPTGVWTKGQAARLGYLIGRGHTVGAIAAGTLLPGISERALHRAARRWLPRNGSGPFVVPISVSKRKALAAVAAACGTTAEALARAVLENCIRPVDLQTPPPPESGAGPEPGPIDLAALLGDEDQKALTVAARVRGVTASELARVILETVLADGLLGAVLDDEGDR
jgi:hypothetical protein